MISKIKLSTLPSSTNSAVHVAVFVDSIKDNGILYLTDSEYESFVEIVRAGCIDKNIHFESHDERNQYQSDYEY